MHVRTFVGLSVGPSICPFESVLCDAVHCAVLDCSVLRCAVLCHAGLGRAWLGLSAMWYCMVRCSALWIDVVFCAVVHHIFTPRQAPQGNRQAI